ncbi:hypothetical protein [Bosea sp. RAC05]|uniref:hypothetical protein n=1 Tax=Bosea sp. RAC05 TaxID=1842539 RepID=UPI00083DC9B7|nr:hypothetical protein [Bosea sp. RAC05]
MAADRALTSIIHHSAGVPARRAAPQRLPWFDQWAFPKGDALHDLASAIAARLDRDEEERGLRTRRRRGHVERAREQAIGVVVSNLAHTVLDQAGAGRLAVVLGKPVQAASIPKRYLSPADGRMLVALLEQLEALDLVAIERSRRRGEASSLAPTTALAALCQHHQVSLPDFGRLPEEETIIARSRRDQIAGAAPVVLLDYAETGETEGMRSMVAALNAHVAGADIVFLDDGRGAVNAHDRHQRRLFNGPPQEPLQGNGRLYGGFWQNLKRDRRSSLRINGEETAVVDFSSMFVRLAYAKIGVVPPPGDLYALPGLEGHREAVKVLTSTLFFDQRQRHSWPQDDGLVIPKGWSLAKTRAAILDRHPALRASFGHGLGHELMRRESDIMLAILDCLMTMGIVALNLHDGLIVSIADASSVRTMMMEVGHRQTGAILPVTITPSSGAARTNAT